MNETPSNVILLTLDGVRWQEFFGGPNHWLAPKRHEVLFTNFWSELALEGVVYGNFRGGNKMVTGNISLVSLPAYHSILTGRPPACLGSFCHRVIFETLPERLVHELSFSSATVAVFASWKKIALAVEQTPGTIYVDAGPDSIVDPEADKARWDQETFSKALDYLKNKQPRFLFISLNDSDAWAHAQNYSAYLDALRRYDQWISQIVQTLDSMGNYGRHTTLIVTTDHGRGDADEWANHGIRWPESRYVWLYARGPHAQRIGMLPRRLQYVSHLDIRPTIEVLFGLEPQECAFCGQPLKEITGR